MFMHKVFLITSFILTRVFIFWYPITIIHEIGHYCSGTFIGDGSATIFYDFYIFSRTEIIGSNTPVIDTIAGPIFGTVMGIVSHYLSRKLKNKLLLDLSIFSFLFNGLYLSLSHTITNTDSHLLIQLGFPLWALFIIGIPISVLGLFLLILKIDKLLNKDHNKKIQD